MLLRNLILIGIVLPVFSMAKDYDHKFSADLPKLSAGIVAFEFSYLNHAHYTEFNIPIMYFAGGEDSWIHKFMSVRTIQMTGINYRKYYNPNLYSTELFLGIGSRIYYFKREPSEGYFGKYYKGEDVVHTTFISIEPEIGFQRYLSERYVLTVPLGFGVIVYHRQNGEISKYDQVRPMMHFGVELGYRF